MSAWLGGWLKDIVLIVLFAAFVDLLIPHNSLQRYVKVVISLMVLLTILSPVISLIKADDKLDMAAMAALATGKSQPASLSEVLAAGERLQEASTRQSTATVERQLADMIADRLQQLFAVTVEAVEPRIATDREKGARLQSVRLLLALGDNDEQQAESSSVAAIKPVVPVESVKPVQIGVAGTTSLNREASAGEAVTATDAPDQRTLASRIRAYMHDWLTIDEDAIHIEWGGGMR